MRSAHFGQNGPIVQWRLGRVPRSPSFFWFGTPRDLSATSQRPIFTKYGHVVRCQVAESGKTFSETFHFRGHLPPKFDIEIRSNRHLTQSRQVTGCTAEKYCLLHIVVQGPGSFQDRSTFLHDVRLRSYGASNLPNFSDFGLFSPYKTPKKYLPMTSLQAAAQTLHRRMITILPCG